MKKMTDFFALPALLVAALITASGCSDETGKPAEAAPTAPTTTTTATATATATAANSAASTAAADIKPENADQVASALEKEIDADAADEDKE